MKKIEADIPKLKHVFACFAEDGIKTVHVVPSGLNNDYGFINGKGGDRIVHTTRSADPFYPGIVEDLNKSPSSEYWVEISTEDMIALALKGLWTRTSFAEDGKGRPLKFNPVNVRKALDLL